MSYDARDGYVVLFGGLSLGGALGDTWTYEYGRWTQVSTTTSPAPSPRYDAGLIYDTLDSEIVLFGGVSATGAPLSDTWAFAGGVWTNLTASAGPAPPPGSPQGSPTTRRTRWASCSAAPASAAPTAPTPGRSGAATGPT